MSDPERPGPRSCFISHSYGDQTALTACLKRRFPNGWQPYVFPPLETPEQAISEHLIDALTACKGLAYLSTPTSLASFWVGFERNMAARLGKRVYAFHPRRPVLAFTRDRREAADPIVSVLFNTVVREDAQSIGEIRDRIWDRYRFEIRGDQWTRLDNEARQMIDTETGRAQKLSVGGVILLFLSTASVCNRFHDYLDPFAYRRASKDMETPVGATAAIFATLPPERTLVLWLDPPDRERIEATLAVMPPETWSAYVRLVRASLEDPHRLVVRNKGGDLNLYDLDTMLARATWAAIKVDRRLARSYLQALASKPKIYG